MLQKYFPNFVGKTQSVMQKDIKSFFHPVNPQMNIPDCEYDRTGLCIDMAKALARTITARTSCTYRPTRFSSAVIHRKMCNRKVMPFILMSFRLTR